MNLSTFTIIFSISSRKIYNLPANCNFPVFVFSSPNPNFLNIMDSGMRLMLVPKSLRVLSKNSFPMEQEIMNLSRSLSFGGNSLSAQHYIPRLVLMFQTPSAVLSSREFTS